MLRFLEFTKGFILQSPNAQHERRKAAASGRRSQTEVNGWPPSAPCCSSAKLGYPLLYNGKSRLIK